MKTSWDLTCFYQSSDDPKIEEDKKVLLEKANEFANKWKNRKDYLENPEVLKEALDDYESWQKNYGATGNPYYYFALKTVLDKNDPILRAKFNQCADLAIKIQNLVQFFELNLVNTKITNISGFEHFLEKLIRQKPHVLSEPEEKIINLKSQSSYDFWVEMTEKFLAKEVHQEKGFSEILNLLSDKNKKTRDKWAKVFEQILEKHSDAAETELNAILQDKKVNDELRSYQRPDRARHLSDDIDTDVVDAIVKTVTDNFSISQSYYQIKAKALKVKKLKYYEKSVPVGTYDKKYSVEQSIDLVNKTFLNIDNEFGEIFQRLLNNGQIDFMPAKGKSSGAACWHMLKSQPTFLFLNFTGKLRDITTLAHEMGHAINNELCRKQNALNFGTPLSTAEVASTFFEDFVLDEVIKNLNEKDKKGLMFEKMDDLVATIFRQVALYNFETELHATFRKTGYLSKKIVGDMFVKHMRSYLGPAIDLSGAANYWVYWSHIRNYFYVYSYASGLLISKYLQRNKANIKEFLSAGLSDSPKNIFAKIGIDITDKKFWADGLNEVKNELKYLYDKH